MKKIYFYLCGLLLITVLFADYHLIYKDIETDKVVKVRITKQQFDDGFYATGFRYYKDGKEILIRGNYIIKEI